MLYVVVLVWRSQTLYLEGRVWGHVMRIELSPWNVHGCNVYIINRKIIFWGRG